MDKSFENLYKICMAMADTCLTDQTLHARFDKLEEEYRELIEQWSIMDKQNWNNTTLLPFNEQKQGVKDEASDVLFVLLHLCHKLEFTPHELLHHAASKMLKRLNDPTYIAKEQRNG